MPERYHPSAVLKAYREEHPGAFDGFDDKDLLDAIGQDDPDTFNLIDPLLIGAEGLGETRTGMRGPTPTYARPAPGKDPRLVPPKLPQPTVGATALRVVPAVAGGLFGTVAGAGPWGTAAGGMLGASGGEAAAQYYEKTFGPRETYTPEVIATEGLLGAIPIPFAKMGRAARIGTAAAAGAGFGTASEGARTYFEEDRLPGMEELGPAALLGGGFGGVTGGVMEVAGSILGARRAAVAEQLRIQKEQQLATGLSQVFTGKNDRSWTDLQKAKGFLDEMASGVATPPPVPRGLLPERAGPSSPLPPETILGMPPGANPDPNAIDVLGDRRVAISSPPPDPLEQAIGDSLQMQPGLPRLRQASGAPPLVLSRPGVADEVGDPFQGELMPPPLPSGRIQQTGEIGGAPPEVGQPRLPQVLTPRPVERSYPEGPNVNPRRRGEVHGTPRQVRRQVRTGKVLSYETHPAAIPAEDPGMYPAEVRRELGRMLYELETFRHERIQGGTTKGQLEYMTEAQGMKVADAVAELRGKGVTKGGAIKGAPVYHEVIEAAKGARAHATREEMIQALRGALLEGKGDILSDAAAQVARGRLGNTRGHAISSSEGAGDHLIGWVDEAGEKALPPADMPPEQQLARDLDDGDVHAAMQILDELGGLPGVAEDSQAYFRAAQDEAVRRGLRTPEQGELRMEGPGGDGGVPIRDFEPGGPPPDPTTRPEERLPQPRVDRRMDPARRAQFEQISRSLYDDKMGAPIAELHAKEAPPNPEAEAAFQRTQRMMAEAPPDPNQALPGLGGVRNEQRLLPPVADAPFALTPPPRPAVTKAQQRSLWERLQDEEGVLVFDIPAGDRTGIRTFLKRAEGEHAGEAWHARAEEAMEAGDWDRAWKVAMSASRRSYAKAWVNAKDPREQELLRQAVAGTPLQDDINAQIIGQARQRSGLAGPAAPKVGDAPPSLRISQAGAARGKARVGPAGILDPGRPQRPLRPQDRAHTLPRVFTDMILAETDAELIHLVPGNRDSRLRLYQQVAELAMVGKNTRELKQYVNLSNQEVAQHWAESVREGARLLQSLGAYAQKHNQTLTEAAEAISFGGALRGFKGQTLYGARGRAVGKVGSMREEETLKALFDDTQSFDKLMTAMALQKPKRTSELELLHASSYPFMLSLPATAVRNFQSFLGRYSVDALADALTIPLEKMLGTAEGAALAKGKVQEKLKLRGKGGAVVTPRTSWKGTLQEIYDFTAESVGQLSPADARRTINLLRSLPDQEAHFLGMMAGGEEMAEGGSRFSTLNAILNPKVQRLLTVFNRAQEFTGRGLVFDATVRAQLRAKGLNPDDVLQQPLESLISQVGGQQSYEDLIYAGTAAALESTFSGQAARESIPGALLQWVNNAWPFKLGYPFPKFNIVTAPRWIYDHSPAALMELIRFPLDTVGLTSSGFKGGRLYRGIRAEKLQRQAIPELAGKRALAMEKLGATQRELLATSREMATRNRQVGHLEKRAAGQNALPEVTTKLDNARALRDQLQRRRATLEQRLEQSKGAVRNLTAQEDHFRAVVADATGINAPNLPQYLARMTAGTALLGAAAVIRSQKEAEGTRWYEYRVDRGEGQDPEIIDLRAYAPFAQYLYVADVMQDLSRFTNWEDAKVQAETDGWSAAIWDNYEGKYTAAELGAEFGKAFLSISRAAGTSLTLTDLLTQNGWPSVQDASDAVIGTVGQFLSRYTTPARFAKDLVAAVDPEEAKVRMTPRATLKEPYGPLGAPLTNVPGLSRLVPETVSQTSGKPMTTAHPLLRALAGVGSAPRDFVSEEIRRVGVPGATVFIRETGEVGVDKLVAETYGGILQRELPAFLKDDFYQKLGSPARQRDYLQRRVFPRLKRMALAEVKGTLGQTWTDASVQGENKRRAIRTERLLEQLDEEAGGVREIPDGDGDLGAPPPEPASIGAPPPLP